MGGIAHVGDHHPVGQFLGLQAGLEAFHLQALAAKQGPKLIRRRIFPHKQEDGWRGCRLQTPCFRLKSSLGSV